MSVSIYKTDAMEAQQQTPNKAIATPHRVSWRVHGAFIFVTGFLLCQLAWMQLQLKKINGTRNAKPQQGCSGNPPPGWKKN